MPQRPLAQRILVFSRTNGFRHGSIEAGIAAVHELAASADVEVEATEDPTVFTAASLEAFGATVWLSTSGTVLNDDQRAAFQRSVEAGAGYLGIHSASNTEYGWPWYGQLVGAWFDEHPEVQAANVEVVDRGHPATAHLPEVWPRVDEWYDFVSPPRAEARVLVKVDESSYVGGAMGSDHPLAWCHDHEGGRSLFTAMGHTDEIFSEQPFRQHLLGALQWVLHRT